MIAKTNAIYLGKKNYLKRDKETDDKILMRVYDFLVFDERLDTGLKKPELRTMVVTDNDKHEVAESLSFFEECTLVFDVVVGHEGKFYFKPIDVERK